MYLRYADREHFDNQVLFYYRTPGIDLFHGIAKTSILMDRSQSDARTNDAIRALVRPLLKHHLLSDALSFLRARPLIPRLVNFMRSAHCDVVHVNNTFTFQPASILAASMAGIPVVAHVRNPGRLSAFSKVLARRVKCFVPVNQTLTDWLKLYRVQPVREAIEAKHAEPAVAEHMRATAGRGNLVVGSVGRLDIQKGYEYLIRAAQVVCRNRLDVSFVIAGDGSLRNQLQRLIDSLGLNGRFSLLGFRDDPEVVTAGLDLFVCSSLWEGSPLSVLDALAAGIPVVSTRVGVVPEVISHGRTGWLVEPRDVESLASTIIESLGISQEVRLETALAGRLAVAPYLDGSGLARQFEAVLDSV
ncbi:MAG: glycosyltransferase [Acidimicrobiales bacterium]